MSIDISNAYADYTVHGGNQEESLYEIPGDPESAKTAEKKSRLNSRTSKCVGVLSLITMLNLAMFIALMAMHFQVQSNWRHEFIKIQDSIEQLNVSAANSENALQSMRAGRQSIQGSIETKVDTLNVSIRNILRTQSAIQAASGWHISGNFVYKYFNASVTYLTASSSCQNLGGRLAATILRDPNAIRDIIQKNYVGMQRASSNFWIGYDDRITEGKWQWADSGDANSFVIWDSGQPDNSKNEDCAHVWNVRNGRLVMNDARCTSNSYSYLCEFSSL